MNLIKKHRNLKKYNSKFIYGLRGSSYKALIFELEETERRIGLAPENKKLTFINIDSLINKLEYPYDKKKDIELICEYFSRKYKNNENYIKILKYNMYCEAVYEKLKLKEISAYAVIFEDETVVFSYPRVDYRLEDFIHENIKQSIEIRSCKYKELDLENYIEVNKDNEVLQEVLIDNTDIFKLRLNQNLVESSTLLMLTYNATKYSLIIIQDNKNLTNIQSSQGEILQNVSAEQLELLMESNPNLGTVHIETRLNNWLIINILNILSNEKMKAEELSTQDIMFIEDSQKENSTAYKSYIKDKMLGSLKEYRRIGYTIGVNTEAHKIYIISKSFYVEALSKDKNSLVKIAASEEDFDEIRRKVIGLETNLED